MIANSANVGKRHVELMGMVFYQDGGELLCANRDEVRQGLPTEVLKVCEVAALNPKLLPVIEGSPILYQQLTYQYFVLQSIIELLDRPPFVKGQETFIRQLQDAQNAIMMTQEIAVKGLQTVILERGLDK